MKVHNASHGEVVASTADPSRWTFYFYYNGQKQYHLTSYESQSVAKLVHDRTVRDANEHGLKR